MKTQKWRKKYAMIKGRIFKEPKDESIGVDIDNFDNVPLPGIRVGAKKRTNKKRKTRHDISR